MVVKTVENLELQEHSLLLHIRNFSCNKMFLFVPQCFLLQVTMMCMWECYCLCVKAYFCRSSWHPGGTRVLCSEAGAGGRPWGACGVAEFNDKNSLRRQVTVTTHETYGN